MPLENRVGPGDPIVWKGHDGRWYAALAATLGDRAKGCNSTMPCGGVQEMCVGSSPYASDTWSCNRTLFRLNQQPLILPAIVPHRVATQEFITPDFFGGLPGDGAAVGSVRTQSPAHLDFQG